MSGLGEFLFGSKDKMKKVPTGSPQQQSFHNNILSQLQQMLQGGGGYDQSQKYYQNLLQGGQEGFENFSDPYMQQFNEQALPEIAERFAGAGALSSSGFGQALGGARAGLQSQLAQLFSALQNQAAGSLTNQFNQLGQTGLNYQPFAYQNKKGNAGFLGPLAGGIAGSFAGPLGSALGGMAGQGLSSLFRS